MGKEIVVGLIYGMAVKITKAHDVGDLASQSSGTEVLRMVEALGRELSDMAGQEDAWLNRYEDVAQAMKENNKASEELLSISRMAVPVIWNTFMGNYMMHFMTAVWEEGGVAGHGFSSRGHVPPPPPKFVFVYPTELTADKAFVIQAMVVPTAEANLGFCAYFEPEEGDELDFDNGDIFFASHIRWHFDYGNSREIAFNDRYNGEWSRPEVTVGGDQWPDFTVGESFIISVTKMGPCFITNILLGRDSHGNTPEPMQGFTFCPKPSARPIQAPTGSKQLSSFNRSSPCFTTNREGDITNANLFHKLSKNSPSHLLGSSGSEDDTPNKGMIPCGLPPTVLATHAQQDVIFSGSRTAYLQSSKDRLTPPIPLVEGPRKRADICNLAENTA